MRIPRIYQADAVRPGQELELDAMAFQHSVKALRMQPGQRIDIFNGVLKGYFEGTLNEVSKRHATVQLQQFRAHENESPLHVHIGQTLSRGERMDYAVQKATETGMNVMTPLYSERCEVKLQGDRTDKRLQHWQQVAISACEQCIRPVVPAIQAPEPLSDWLKSVDAELKLVLHHRSSVALQSLPKPASIALLIGPEGGLTEDEIAQAEAAGFQSVTMGPRVLRTETAPVVALSLCQMLWGDF
ncbi:16S rRNA (uracil(1498)-N(3))-methyltransferase [Pokkaliibacter sp. CJK22405]|uniref:16S rRNA (uracil(1498)-N(3))-methyltransferase n=1 Tax=Pokkaliibacter sp. CJK22405 TaxID=3384615 RepID=UPI003984AF63